MEPLIPIDELIAKSLAGETSPEEDAQLKSWEGDDPRNRLYAETLRRLWEETAGIRPLDGFVPDTEKALAAVHRRMDAPSGFSAFRSWMPYAAAAAVALLVAAWWLFPRDQPTHVIAAVATPLSESLADGSVVDLDKGARLSILPSFNRQERRVSLSGAAVFKIVRDAQRPFIVRARDLDIRVTGTVFQVENPADSAAVTVRVFEGTVKLEAAGADLALRAGESAVYTPGNLRRIENSSPPPPAPLQNLRFMATPLRQVVTDLERAYGRPVRLGNPILGPCQLTAQYPGLPLERVLELIAEAFPISVEMRGDTIYLNGNGCGE